MDNYKVSIRNGFKRMKVIIRHKICITVTCDIFILIVHMLHAAACYDFKLKIIMPVKTGFISGPHVLFYYYKIIVIKNLTVQMHCFFHNYNPNSFHMLRLRKALSLTAARICWYRCARWVSLIQTFSKIGIIALSILLIFILYHTCCCLAIKKCL